MKNSKSFSQKTTPSSSLASSEDSLPLLFCCECNKQVEGFYGRTKEGGYCSRKCGEDYKEKTKWISVHTVPST